MTVAELYSRMGATEFDDWREYYEEEPWGANRDNWHMAQVANLYMQVHGKKDVKHSPADFFYRSAAESEKRSIRVMMAGMDTIAANRNKK